MEGEYFSTWASAVPQQMAQGLRSLVHFFPIAQTQPRIPSTHFIQGKRYPSFIQFAPFCHIHLHLSADKSQLNTWKHASCPTNSSHGYCRWNSCPGLAINLYSFLVFKLRMNNSQPLKPCINHNPLPFLTRKKKLCLCLWLNIQLSVTTGKSTYHHHVLKKKFTFTKTFSHM